MAKNDLTMRVKFSGPFFERDPRRTFRANVAGFMDKLAAEGERDIVTQLRSGESSRWPLGLGLGRVSRHVVGRTRSHAGKRWEVSAVVGVSTKGLSRKQAIKLQAAASWLESQGHPVRRTTGRIKRSRREQVALLRGIA